MNPKKAKETERIFIEEYLQHWNATEAYHRAHPRAQRNTCWTEGNKTLRKPEVQAEIKKRLDEASMTADEVLVRLGRHAKASHEPWMRIEKDGFVHLDFSSQEARGQLDLIKKIRTKRTRRVEGRGKDAEQWEDETVEVELVDQQNALIQIGKHHQLFMEKIKVDMPLTVVGLSLILDKVYGKEDAGDPGS